MLMNKKRALERIHPTTGCVWCDLGLPIFVDSNGPYHDGPEDTRIDCDDDALRITLRTEGTACT